MIIQAAFPQSDNLGFATNGVFKEGFATFLGFRGVMGMDASSAAKTFVT